MFAGGGGCSGRRGPGGRDSTAKGPEAAPVLPNPGPFARLSVASQGLAQRGRGAMGTVRLTSPPLTWRACSSCQVPGPMSPIRR